MLKLLPTLAMLAVMVAGAFAEPMQGFVSEHPALYTVLSTLAAVLAHWLPSPKKQPDL